MEECSIILASFPMRKTRGFGASSFATCWDFNLQGTSIMLTPLRLCAKPYSIPSKVTASTDTMTLSDVTLSVT
jgi:hypothetical protein